MFAKNGAGSDPIGIPIFCWKTWSPIAKWLFLIRCPTAFLRELMSNTKYLEYLHQLAMVYLLIDIFSGSYPRK